MGHFHMVILTDGMDSREDTGGWPGSQHSVEETAILLGLLGAAGVEYNTHWIGVLLNSEAEQKLGALTRVGGEKSSYARCQDHSEIASKFQEIAIKIVQRPEAAAAAALASALASAAGAQPGQISGPRTAYAGSIQQGSHVEITNATHGGLIGIVNRFQRAVQIIGHTDHVAGKAHGAVFQRFAAIALGAAAGVFQLGQGTQ